MAHHHGEHPENHTPKHYVRIWAVLCVLLFVSIAGPMLEIPVVTLITAFGIAGVKAFLVIKHFMHLDEEKPIVMYILTTGIVFMCIMFFAVSVDVMNHDGARWTNDAAKQAVVRGMKYGDPADHHVDHGGGAHGEAAGGH